MTLEKSTGARPASKFGAKGGKGKPVRMSAREAREARDARDRAAGKYVPKLLGKSYFQRKKGCPFSGPKAPKIDYKDIRMLVRYITDNGKMMPRHLTGVSAIKQRELATAIKRARMLALLGFTNKPEREDRPAFSSDRGDRADRGPRKEFTPRPPRAEAAAE
jgi:small subunit ribosomal protein S18